MSRHLVDPQLVAALEMFAPLDMELSRINETRALVLVDEPAGRELCAAVGEYRTGRGSRGPKARRMCR